MATIKSTSLLTIEYGNQKEAIEIDQFLKFLRKTGNFSNLLGEYIKQYTLEQMIKSESDLNIDLNILEQAIINFRMQNNLSDQQRFHQWLSNNILDYQDFRDQILFSLQVAKLKDKKITDAQVQDYFARIKPALDRVVLSRLVVATEEVAKKIHEKLILKEDVNQFYALVKKESISSDKSVNGMMGPINIENLVEPIKNQIKEAKNNSKKGHVIGAFNIDNNYVFFRIEEFLDANFEAVKGNLKNQLFDEWLKRQASEWKININLTKE